MLLLFTVLVFLTTIHHNNSSSDRVPCNNATEILHIVNSTESVCLNASKVERSAVVFPKCCPLDFVYDTQTRSCKETDLNRSIYLEKFAFFKIGLRSCVLDAVVVDFVTDLENFERNEVNGTATLTTNETTTTFEKGKFCVDDLYNRSSNSSIVVRVCSANLLKECGTTRKCLRKCCPDLEFFNERKVCTPFAEQGVDYYNWKKASKVVAGGNFSIIHGLSCRRYNATDYKQFYFDEWGNITVLLVNKWKRFQPHEEILCREHLLNTTSGHSEDLVLMCMVPPSKKFNYTRIAMAVSCFFILLTIVTYVWLLETDNVFSKAVVSYCVSLFGTFLLLTYAQWADVTNEMVCTGLGYAVIAFLLSTFVWMNALCIDIWLTFGSDSALMTMKEEWEDRKRFLIYSVYGWGLPLALVSIIAFFKHTNYPPQYLKPLFGKAKCIMYTVPGNYSKLLLYVFPITALKICDVILFIRTSMYCIQVKNAITNMKDENSSCDWKRRFLVDKERLTLLIKLFIIMGIPWLFEVVTSIFHFDLHPALEKIETTWDIINCLQGVYVFIVFVCKRKVLELFIKKTPLKRRKLSLSSAATQSSILVSKSCSGKR